MLLGLCRARTSPLRTPASAREAARRRWNRFTCAYERVVPSVPSMRAGRSPKSAAWPRTASWMGSSTGGTSAYSLRNTVPPRRPRASVRPAYGLSGASVRLGQAEGLVGDVVENHLPAHRSNTSHARGRYQRGEAEFPRESVAAEGVHGLVDGPHAGLACR